MRTLCSLLAALILLPAAHAGQAKLAVKMSHPIVLAGKKRIAHLKVSLTGFAHKQGAKRVPINVAIVLDRSGSMNGEKLRQAKKAAIVALERLRPTDIASVVCYDSTVQVLVPATRLSDRRSLYAAINRISASGSTALFAGVSKGASEVKKFLDKRYINRVVLLSDGLANVGPQTTEELGQLGASLARSGISVTTVGLGLGYNEDLMTRLARRSDGNHHFVENARDLTRIFDHEFGAGMTVVGSKSQIALTCAEGVRPVRVLGREADISGQKVSISLGQVYSEWERYAILEVELPSREAGQLAVVARVKVAYDNMISEQRDTLSGKVAVRYSASAAEVAKAADRKVIEAVVEMIGVLNNKMAVLLRDEGKIQEARNCLFKNTQYLDKYAKELKSAKLEQLRDWNQKCVDGLEGKDWNKSRKQMRSEQYKHQRQQK